MALSDALRMKLSAAHRIASQPDAADVAAIARVLSPRPGPPAHYMMPPSRPPQAPGAALGPPRGPVLD